MQILFIAVVSSALTTVTSEMYNHSLYDEILFIAVVSSALDTRHQ